MPEAHEVAAVSVGSHPADPVQHSADSLMWKADPQTETRLWGVISQNGTLANGAARTTFSFIDEAVVVPAPSGRHGKMVEVGAP